jgi:hypothetical protein
MSDNTVTRRQWLGSADELVLAGEFHDGSGHFHDGLEDRSWLLLALSSLVHLR